MMEDITTVARKKIENQKLNTKIVKVVFAMTKQKHSVSNLVNMSNIR